MANVICKTVGNNQVGFYLQDGGKEYFLCKQRYYRSAWDYFVGGVHLDELFNKSGKHSHAIREVKMKLPAYIEYVEREEGVRVLKKTKAKGEDRIGTEKRRKSKNCGYNWRNDRVAEIV